MVKKLIILLFQEIHIEDQYKLIILIDSKVLVLQNVLVYPIVYLFKNYFVNCPSFLVIKIELEK